ncbi:MAG: tripartite tricarboxylate transporter TctB family protein, partial [Candidatus Velthaea sp.]
MRTQGGRHKRMLSFSRGMLIALFAFGALLFAGTFGIDAAAAQPPDIGPLFVPRIFSGALMLFAAIEFVRYESVDNRRIPYDRLVLVAMFVAIGYALALPVLGYVLSTCATLTIVLLAIRAGG